MTKRAWATALGGCLCALGCSGEDFASAPKGASGAAGMALVGAGAGGSSGSKPSGSGGSGDRVGAAGEDPVGDSGEPGTVMGHPRGGSSGNGSGGTDQGEGGEMPSVGGSDALGGTGGTDAAGSGGSAGLPVGGAGGSVAGTGGVELGGGSGTGPVGGSGGSVATGCGLDFAVSSTGFVRAPMAGGACWHGYASAGTDTLVPGAGTVSMTTPTSFMECGEGCALHTAGNLSSSDSAFAYVGFNVNEDGSSKGKVAPAGNGIKVTFGKSGTFSVRIELVSGGTHWCANATASPASIPYSTFATECWEGGAGTSYANQPIESVRLLIPGKAASETTFDITLVSVEEI